jgi:hypothetical protein
MPFRADKVRGHAEHVLDAFLRLRATYAVLDPLLFNSELRARWTSGAGIRGRETLVASLLYMCVLEASKLATDRYSQTPSLRNLDASLDDKAVVAELRNSYAEWNLPSNSDDPDVIRLLERMEAQEKTVREAEFNSLVSEFRQGWSEFVSSNTFGAFKTLRDKVIAHTKCVMRTTSTVLTTWPPSDSGSLTFERWFINWSRLLTGPIWFSVQRLSTSRIPVANSELPRTISGK